MEFFLLILCAFQIMVGEYGWGVMYMSEKGYTDTNSEYMKVSSLIVHLRSYTGPSLHKGLFRVIYLTSVFSWIFWHN